MTQANPIKVLITGASYAGLATATNLLDLSEGRPQRFHPTEAAPTTKFSLEITIVDERDGYYHVIGSPLALASSTFAERSWTRFEEIPGLRHPAIKFVHGSVIKVDTNSKIVKISLHGSNGEGVLEKTYDYLLAASGLRRVAPVVPKSLTRDDYLIEAGKHIDRVRGAIGQEGVVVIGGGAVGIEMAAELKLVYPDLQVRLIHSRDQLMSNEPLPDDFKFKTLELLRDVGVEVITGKRVEDISKPQDTDSPTKLKLSGGEVLSTSFIINAISHATATSEYLPEAVLTPEGYVKITPTLHFLPRAPDLKNKSSSSLSPATDTAPQYNSYHFAAGDVTNWPGIRRCGSAMHMGSHVAHNIHIHITSILSPSPSSAFPLPYKSLQVWAPGIGLALGNTAIAYYPGEGIKSGPEVLKMMFQDDIGFEICWNYMKLGEVPEGCRSEVFVGIEGGHSQIGAVEGPLSSPGSSGEGSPIEPSTPFDGVGSAEGAEVKVLGADLEDSDAGMETLTMKTRMSPIGVAEGSEM